MEPKFVRHVAAKNTKSAEILKPCRRFSLCALCVLCGQSIDPKKRRSNRPRIARIGTDRTDTEYLTRGFAHLASEFSCYVKSLLSVRIRDLRGSDCGTWVDSVAMVMRKSDAGGRTTEGTDNATACSILGFRRSGGRVRPRARGWGHWASEPRAEGPARPPRLENSNRSAARMMK